MELLKYLVNSYSSGENTLLDTSIQLIALNNADKEYASMELDDKYYKIAKERMLNKME